MGIHHIVSTPASGEILSEICIVFKVTERHVAKDGTNMAISSSGSVLPYLKRKCEALYKKTPNYIVDVCNMH